MLTENCYIYGQVNCPSKRTIVEKGQVSGRSSVEKYSCSDCSQDLVCASVEKVWGFVKSQMTYFAKYLALKA